MVTSDSSKFDTGSRMWRRRPLLRHILPLLPFLLPPSVFVLVPVLLFDAVRRPSSSSTPYSLAFPSRLGRLSLLPPSRQGRYSIGERKWCFLYRLALYLSPSGPLSPVPCSSSSAVLLVLAFHSQYLCHHHRPLQYRRQNVETAQYRFESPLRKRRFPNEKNGRKTAESDESRQSETAAKRTTKGLRKLASNERPKAAAGSAEVRRQKTSIGGRRRLQKATAALQAAAALQKCRRRLQ